MRRQKGADTLHVRRIPHRVYIQCTVSQIFTELDSDKSTTFIFDDSVVRYLLSFCHTGYQKPWVTLGRENEGVLADTEYISSQWLLNIYIHISLSLDIFDYHLNPLMKKLYYLWNVPRLIKLLFIWLYLYPADPVHGLQHEYCQEFWARCHHELLGVPLGKSSHDINIRII